MTDDPNDAFKGRALARAKALRRQDATPTHDAPTRIGAAPARNERAAPIRAEPSALDAPPPPTHGTGGHMIDVGAKPVIHREATAEGFLRLRPETLDALRRGAGPKGDPFPFARAAALLAAKRTPDLLPHCHPLPLNAVDVDLAREAAGVRCRATVRADARTGVEMEALTAVSVALLTVWDMVKSLEKDAHGQYPGTVIEGVRVLEKVKGAAH